MNFIFEAIAGFKIKETVYPFILRHPVHIIANGGQTLHAIALLAE